MRESLTELIGKLGGRIAVTAFASNVARLDSVARAAARHGRSVVLAGRSMRRIVDAAKACGYLQGLPRFLEEGEGTNLRPERALYLCTGSQGEPRAALARIAAGNHPNVTLEAGDAVIFSSRIIPGNERAIFALHNALVARGISVITAQDHFVHVSGHPCRDELARMYQWLRPRIAVPVHGERRHLVEHVAFAKSLQIPETVLAPNGSLVRLAPGPAAVIDEVESGRLHLSGNRLVPERDEALRERRRIAYSGLVFGNARLRRERQVGAFAARHAARDSGPRGGRPGGRPRRYRGRSRAPRARARMGRRCLHRRDDAPRAAQGRARAHRPALPSARRSTAS